MWDPDVTVCMYVCFVFSSVLSVIIGCKIKVEENFFGCDLYDFASMPGKKKYMGAGAVVKVLLRYVHPSAEIRSKYVNPDIGERLSGCVLLKKGIKVVNRKDQAVIIFRHEEFENTELYAVSRYVAIEEEGPSTESFNDEDNGGVDEEAVENITVVCEEVEDISVRDVVTLIDHL